MAINITNGPTGAAQKGVIYGPEGSGKTSLGKLSSSIAPAIFIDTEGSTSDYSVSRIECHNWADVEAAIEYLLNENHSFKTAIFDTITAAEKFIETNILATEKKRRMADFNYGKGSVFLREETDIFVSKLDLLVRKGINVLLIAHSQVKRYQDPQTPEGYDRHVMALDEKASSTIKRWAKFILFLNFKHVLIETDERKTRGRGGDKRIIFTEHRADFDAKNRVGLPREIPFEKDVWPEALNALFSPPALSGRNEALFEAFCQLMEDLKPEVVKAYLIERGEIGAEGTSRDISPEFLQLIVDNPDRFKAAIGDFEKTLQPLPAA
jgi:hypothetical protein